MTRVLAAATVLTFFLNASPPAPLAGQEAGEEAESAEVLAQAAAAAWLELIDTGDFEQSWERSGEHFRASIAAEAWAQQAAQAQSQLGAVQERTFDSAEAATDPPNAPAGEYMAVRYRSAFANLPGALEVVITMKEPDENWRVVGYFVQPGG